MAPNPVPLCPRRLAASGLRLHASESAFREGSATIVMPTASAAFLNPVQEFNRDLSVLAIRTWSEMMDAEMRKKWQAKEDRRKAGSNGKKRHGGSVEGDERVKRVKAAEGDGASVAADDSSQTGITSVEATSQPQATDRPGSTYRPFRFTVLEALSATGLRSIRYAKEIPLLKNVLANDLSASAVKAMKRNVALNFPDGQPIEDWVPEAAVAQSQGKDGGKAPTEDELTEMENQGKVAAEAAAAAGPALENASASVDEATTAQEADIAQAAIHPDCKITINEGDALDVMYSHRNPRSRFHVIDLDPYGSAAPFLDGAVQSVADGGLLCVTCTDLAVLASNNYPEKCFALYGGTSTRTEYCHEAALRLVLHSIASTAARYGRYIKPLLSLSIDFYLRVFVQVQTAPIEVKNLASKTGLVYTCSYCHNFHQQRLGRTSDYSGKKGQPLTKYQTAVGPPAAIQAGATCEECNSRYHMAGPMWLDSIHDPTFCKTLLGVLDRQPERSKTAPRIRGMVGTAATELSDAPFYFIPAKISGLMHSRSPSLLHVTNALLHAGYRVSRSHCAGGSIKTDASRAQLYDIWRDWIDQGNPIKLEGISEGSPARALVLKGRRTAQESTGEPAAGVERGPARYVFEKEHPDAQGAMFSDDFGGAGESTVKAVRYQQNPLPNWGPGTAANMTAKTAASTESTD
ncbi:unnamed protein product [Parajaminaea phylloscopi]